jgi:hypothetical protein
MGRALRIAASNKHLAVADRSLVGRAARGIQHLTFHRWAFYSPALAGARLLVFSPLAYDSGRAIPRKLSAKELVMLTPLRVIEVLALVLVASLATNSPASAQAKTAAGEQKEELPKEETVEAYDSKTAGAIEVRGHDGGEWFRVLKDGKQAYEGAPPLLNSAKMVPPGEYDVLVNKTKRTVKVEAGKKVVLLTGTLVVEGTKANFYTPIQDKDRKIANAPPLLNEPIALFAGTYHVELNLGVKGTVVLTDSAKVVAGKKTVLKE